MSELRKLLKKCRKERREIIILTEKREQIQASLLPKTLLPTTDKVQSSPKQDPIGEAVTAAMELDRAIDTRLAKLYEDDKKAHELVSELDDPDCRQVLELYYLSFNTDDGSQTLHTWDTVAYKLDFSTDHVWHLHAKAFRREK